MKNVCFITSARSEYGLLKWLMKDIEDSDDFNLQLIVTGAHLSKDQGYTLSFIEQDGFNPDFRLDVQLDTGSKEKIASSMGRIAENLAPVFTTLNPDYIIVLGDRYELLPICNTAYIMDIPIIHLSGGDITEGAIDDGIRNAITMLASYHFPGTVDSMKNIVRMRGSNDNMWVVGEPGLDYINRITLMTKHELASNLELDVNKKWILFTFHAETRQSHDYNMNAVKACFDALNNFSDLHIIATYSNADYGGSEINEYLEERAASDDHLTVIPSLGNLRYLSLLKYAAFMIGNSSSGIIEAPLMKCPVINLGDRQKGRHQCSNIIQAETDKTSIQNAINIALEKSFDCSDSDYWGDGHTAEKILKILKEVLI